VYRVDNPSSSAALAAPTAPTATPDRYYVDPAGPVPGTIVDAEHLNMIQEEMCNLVTNAGVALSKATRTQLTTVAGGAAAIKSHATDTTSIETLHKHAVIACHDCRAVGAAAEMNACVAADASVASGNRAAVVCGGSNTASGAYSGTFASSDCACSAEGAAALGCSDVDVAGILGVAIGCSDSFVDGTSAVLLASDDAQLHDSNTVAGGGGAAIVHGAANQNLTWKVDCETGNAHYKASVYAGGDPNGAMGTSATCRMDGATGEVTATGGLRITDDTDEAAETYLQTPVNIGATSFASYDVANDSVVATSIVLWSFSTTESLFQGRCVPGLHTVKFEVYNPSGVAATADITFSYIVVNPS
jgi:hypothetical protein